MGIEVWLQLIVEILSSLAIIVPLGITLYKKIKELISERNWPKLVGMVAVYMAEAEEKLIEGTDKKQFVLAMIQTTAAQLGYNLTEEKLQELGDLIDDLCAMSKEVNVVTINEGELDLKTESTEEVEVAVSK